MTDVNFPEKSASWARFKPISAKNRLLGLSVGPYSGERRGRGTHRAGGIATNAPAVSAISFVEILGYHRLTDQDRQYFEAFFIAAPVLNISTEILDQATRLRQRRKVGLGASPPTRRLTFDESGIIVARGEIPVIKLPAFVEPRARGQPP